MSTNWYQGGQFAGQQPQNNTPQPQAQIQNQNLPAPQRKSALPPICFHCEGEHFVIDCPTQRQQVPVGQGQAVSHAPVSNMPHGNGSWCGPSPGGQWVNSGGSSPAPQRAYGPPMPPVVTRFAVPGQPLNLPGPTYIGPQAQAPSPYHQYPASAPPVQAYAPPQSPYPQNIQQYGSPTPHGYNQQSPHPYSAPPASQYGNPGIQSPAPNNFPQPNAPQQYGGSGCQFTPVHNQAQRNNSYPPQNGPWIGQPGQPVQPVQPLQQQTPQWTNPSRASSMSSFTHPRQSQPPQIARFIKDQPVTPHGQSLTQQTPHLEQRFVRNPTPKPETYAVVLVDGDLSLSRRSRSSVAEETPVPNAPSSDPIDADSVVKEESEVESKDESASDPKSDSSTIGESDISSRASTPFKGTGSTPPSSISSHGHTPPSLKDSTASVVECPKTSVAAQPEPGSSQDDGELIEEDIEHQDFNWEYKKIFNEQQPTENVELAQPLSDNFESTPVPLLKATNNSVSRYARKDNAKEFMKSIRNQPQWSYLQEDPGFSEVNFDGELIPLDEVPAWMAARHYQVLHDLSHSRKRARSDEEDEEENVDQDEVDDQIKHETVCETIEEQPSKRQKHEETVNEDAMIVQTYESVFGAPGTPTFTRTTPACEDGDDVWAPQPGEGAVLAKELDPTEVLLRSLGVEGSPKPVRKRSKASLRNSIPPLEIPDQEEMPSTPLPLPQSHIQFSTSPKDVTQGSQSANSMPPQSHGLQPNGISQGSPPPNTAVFNNPQHGMLMQGAPYGIPPQQASYNNGMPQQGAPQNNQPYNNGQLQNSYNNGMIPQTAPPMVNQQHSMPPQASPFYGSGPPQQSYPIQNQYSNSMPPHINAPHGPPPPQQYLQQPYQQQPYQQQPYSMQAQGPSPYPMLQQVQHPMQQQAQPPYVNNQYGPSPNPQGNPQYGPQQGYYGNEPPQFNRPYGNAAQGIPQHGPQVPPAQGIQPRQDSGYGSAQGSYSAHDTGMNGMQKGVSSQPQTQPYAQQQNGSGYIFSPVDSNNQPDHTPREGSLTPISMELLGKTNIPPVTAIIGRKPEPMRQPDDGGTAVRRKPKNPQPVVAAAYGRRW